MLLPLALIAVLAAGAHAAAQAPGGHGAIEEYTETLPGGGGDNPTSDGADSGGGPLSPAQIGALEAQGPEGVKAAEAAQRTGPDRKAGKSAGSGSSDPAAPETDGGAPLSEVIGDLAGGDDSGMGVALPIVLGVALLGALAFVIVRRGGRHTGPA